MRRRGLFRLWVVATAIFVPAVALWQVNQLIDGWESIDSIAIQYCVNQSVSPARINSPNFKAGSSTGYVDKCIHDRGADQTAFQHEHTTAGAYWGEALGLAFVLDLFLSALIAGAFVAVRWVARGFKAEA
jgi:hypothetical protein